MSVLISGTLALSILLAPSAANAVPHTALTGNTVPSIEPPASVVALLDETHPRLIADDEGFDEARDRIADDERVAGWFSAVRSAGDAILLTAPVARPDSANILSAVREVKRRILTLAFLWQVTDDQDYADRAIEELLSASGYTDWSPSHFLDVGEMTGAVAIGYDWLYDVLSDAQRATVRSAIETKALEIALPYYETTGTNFFVGQSHNWNLVTNSVALGALAIGDESPEISDEVLRHSISSIQYGISEYAPDGAYAESPAYWQYGTDYLVSYLAALKTATGTDFGLSELPGIAETGDFGVHVTSPTGHAFNYGDGGTDMFGGVTGGWHSPFMLWLADRYDAPHLAAWQAERADRGPSPLDILWYDPATAEAATHPTETDAVFGGTEVATARSAWDDPYAVYVATKGLRSGYDQVDAHMNLDAGDLVVEANGVRWLEELGADTYQDQYFTWKADSGGRWDYFATRAEGQNTMVLGDGPLPSTALTSGAEITRSGSSAREWYSVTDLTGMYGDRVQKAERGVMLFDDRRQVLIQDEVESTDPIDYRQFLLTRAEVVVADDGRSALLQRGGQRLWLQLLTQDGSIAAGGAEPLPWVQDPGAQKAVTGVTSLMISIPQVTDETVALRLVPLDTGEPVPDSAPGVQALEDWDVSEDAQWLTGVRVGGADLTEFSPDRFRYDVTVASTATRPPSVTVTAAPGVKAKITRSGTVPGTVRISTRHGSEAGPVYVVHVHQPGSLGQGLPVASVSASADDGNAPAAVVDGSLGTRWSAEGDGQHLTLDLGKVRSVASTSLAFYNGHTRTSTFDVLTSVDGENWQTALSGVVTSGRTDDLEPHGFSPRSARYVRIVGHGNSSSAFNSITEVRVHRSAADAAADQPERQNRLDELDLSPSPLPALFVGDDADLTLAGRDRLGGSFDLEDADVLWFSAAPQIATVSEDGTVTAVGGGSTTIGAIVRSGAGWSTVRTTATVLDPGRIEPEADAIVRNASPDSAFGKGNLEVRNNPENASGYERISYLTFPLDALGDRTAASATLHVYGWLSSTGGATEVGVQQVDDTSWGEGTLTWNTMPLRGPTTVTVTVQDTTPRWYEIDVTDAVAAAQANGDEAAGFALVGAVANYGPLVLFASREGDASQRPYLDAVPTP